MNPWDLKWSQQSAQSLRTPRRPVCRVDRFEQFLSRSVPLMPTRSCVTSVLLVVMYMRGCRHVCIVIGSNFSLVHKIQNADACVSVRGPSSYTDFRWLAATCHVLDVGNGGLAACRDLGFHQLAIGELTKPIDETRTSQTEPRQGTVPHLRRSRLPFHVASLA